MSFNIPTVISFAMRQVPEDAIISEKFWTLALRTKLDLNTHAYDSEQMN